MTCWYCKKDEHTRKDCLTLKNKQKNEGKIDHGDAHSISIGEGVTLSVARSVSFTENTWILDLGASFCICPDKLCFSSYRNGENDFVYLGNDRTCKIHGIGDVVIKQVDGKKHTLKDVTHVPKRPRTSFQQGNWMTLD